MRCFLLLFSISFFTHFAQAQHRVPLNFPELGLLEDDLEKSALQSSSVLHEISNRGDVFDQPLRILYWVWNETERTWHKSRQDVFTYNPDQQLIYSIAQNWNGSEWIDQYRANYVYTPDHQLRLFQFESWDGLNWHLYVRFTFEYDEPGQLLTFTTEDWIEDGWVNRSRKLYTYDHIHARNGVTRQEWWQGTWYNRQQEIRQYDADYHCEEELFLEWNGIEWAPSKRHTFTYTPLTQVDNTLQQEKEGAVWNNVKVISYTYDAAGNRTSETHTQLEPDTWQQNTTWTFQYDAHDNVKERTFWSEEEKQWNIRSRDIYTYDRYNRNTSVLTQDYDGQYKNRDYVEYTYREVSGAADPDISHVMILHPIPSNTSLHLTFADYFHGKGQLSIYTLDGKKMISQAFDSLLDQTIPIHLLPNGLYILKFSSKEGIGIKSFVKQ